MSSPAQPAVDRLSPEILATILNKLEGSPRSFSLVSKAWHSVAVDPYNLSRYFLNTYQRFEVIYHAIDRLGSRCSAQLLRLLVRGGAHLSSFLVVVVDRLDELQQSNRLAWIPPDWGLQLPETSRAELRKLAGSLILNESEAIDIEARLFDVYDSALTQVHEINSNNPSRRPVQNMDETRTLLDELWSQLEHVLLATRWIPMSSKDPQWIRIARATCLEPRLLPLLEANGWSYDADTNDSLVRSIVWMDPRLYNSHESAVVNNQWQYLPRARIIVRDLSILIPKSKNLFVSARVAGEIIFRCLSEGRTELQETQYEDALQVLLDLGDRDFLLFSVPSIVQDVVDLLHGTCRSVKLTPQALSWCDPESRTSSIFLAGDEDHVHLQYFWWMITQSAADTDEVNVRKWMASERPLIAGSIRPQAAEDLDKTIPRPKWSKDPSKALDQIADLLCYPFLYSPVVVLREVTKSSYRPTDLPEAARRAAVRMIRLPSKGTTLLGLLNLYPFLIKHVRDEILRHKISIDLLQPADSADPSRPLYSSHKPSFLSPIAFDYQNALERFSFDLGPSPWHENCYAAVPPPCSPPSPFAESVWPISPTGYSTGEGGSVDLGSVTGKYSASEGGALDELASWTKERVPPGTLPVAIALLDVFDKQDPALDVVLSHAVLNLNASVVHFYLEEGVPLRPHHLQALDKLQLPRLTAIDIHLAEHESARSTASGVVDTDPSKRKKRRGGARAGREKRAIKTV